MDQCPNCGFKPGTIGDGIAEQVINHLRKTSGKMFRFTANNKKLVETRISEGATWEDFKHVIANKWREWQGTAYEKHYSPDVLFSAPHFERYRLEPIYTRRGEDPKPSYLDDPIYKEKKAKLDEKLKKIREAGL